MLKLRRRYIDDQIIYIKNGGDYMLNVTEFDLSEKQVQDYMIDSDKVASVQSNNPLEHALLVLTKTGYNAVPVLGFEGEFLGLISKSHIIEEMFGLDQIDVQLLDGKKVEDLMDKEVKTLKLDDTLERALHLLIDDNFVCVVDQRNAMQGILTRRQLLKQIRNQFYRQKAHE